MSKYIWDNSVRRNFDKSSFQEISKLLVTITNKVLLGSNPWNSMEQNNRTFRTNWKETEERNTSEIWIIHNPHLLDSLKIIEIAICNSLSSFNTRCFKSFQGFLPNPRTASIASFQMLIINFFFQHQTVCSAVDSDTWDELEIFNLWDTIYIFFKWLTPWIQSIDFVKKIKIKF